MDQQQQGASPTSDVCDGCSKEFPSLQLCRTCKYASFCSVKCRMDNGTQHQQYCQRMLEAYRSCMIRKEVAFREARIDGNRSNPPQTINIFGYGDADVLWRKDSHAFLTLARASFHLVKERIYTFSTSHLPVKVIKDSIITLHTMIHMGFWHDLHVKQFLPAIYICKGKDQDAFDFMMWYTTAPHETCPFSLGKPTIFEEQNRGKHILDKYPLYKDAHDDPDKFFATSWLFCVPLALIKIRLLLDLQQLKENFDQLEGLSPTERGPKLNKIASEWVVRSGIDLLTWNIEKIDKHIAGLKEDILELAAVPELGLPLWKDLMVQMLVNGPKVIYSDDAELVPPPVRHLMMANYHSWLTTPGALDVFKDLGLMPGA